ncbi:hypothetical protein [Pseudomonas brassicacearum]|uniref:Uncharacterized protein n=1 Tax=Pseudomonas brassicacearum TaxID=930166 RepID=A0A423JRF8_9PSED|nr:hypothetical protein [Pseudomonas brassicacearum]RON40281.1 hypothetical protein BK664_06870 [Pseudomonas brassicacearum]
MAEFTQEQHWEALASIASGAVTKCQERDDSTGGGIFKSLYRTGFITGENLSGINHFSLYDIELTTDGRKCLAAFSADA